MKISKCNIVLLFVSMMLLTLLIAPIPNNINIMGNSGNDHNGAIIPNKELDGQFFPGMQLTVNWVNMKRYFQIAKSVKYWGSSNNITGRNA